MKKIKTLLGITILAGSLMSCTSNGTSSENHGTYFNPTINKYLVIYADQTLDSTEQIISYDSWQIEKSPEWASANPTSESVKTGYIKLNQLYITLEPNTSKLFRNGIIGIRTYNNNTLGLPIIQLGSLNITKPKSELNTEKTAFTFSQTKVASAVLDTLIFTTYADTAFVTSNASWIIPQKNELSSGRHTLLLDMQTNETSTDRNAIVKIITGNNITQEIEIIQKGR